MCTSGRDLQLKGLGIVLFMIESFFILTTMMINFELTAPLFLSECESQLSSFFLAPITPILREAFHANVGIFVRPATRLPCLILR